MFPMVNHLSASLPQLVSNGVFQAVVGLPLLLVLLDILSGILSAVHRGTFDLQRLPDFLGSDIIKYIGAWFLVLFAWIFQGSAAAEQLTATLGMGVLMLSIGKSIYTNLREVLSPVEMGAIDTLGAAVGLPDPVAPAVPLSGAAQVATTPGFMTQAASTTIPQPLPIEQWATSQVPVAIPLSPPLAPGK